MVPGSLVKLAGWASLCGGLAQDRRRGCDSCPGQTRGSRTQSTARSLIGFRICSLSRDNPDSPTHLPWKPCSEDMNDAGAKSSANPRRSTAEIDAGPRLSILRSHLDAVARLCTQGSYNVVRPQMPCEISRRDQVCINYTAGRRWLCSVRPPSGPPRHTGSRARQRMWMCTSCRRVDPSSTREYWQIPRCAKAERTPCKAYRAQ